MDDGLSPNGLQLTSPSDMVGPSPVTSNGTETTEIEDEASDDVAHENKPSPPRMSVGGDSLVNVCLDCQVSGDMLLIALQLKRLSTLSTNLPENFRSSADDESISVIHAPEGYGSFVSCRAGIEVAT